MLIVCLSHFLLHFDKSLENDESLVLYESIATMDIPFKKYLPHVFTLEFDFRKPFRDFPFRKLPLVLPLNLSNITSSESVSDSDKTILWPETEIFFLISKGLNIFGDKYLYWLLITCCAFVFRFRLQ